MLRAAVEKGAGTYAIFNVGNIREFVLGLDASAKMTWRLDGFEPDAWLTEWVGERFSKKQPEIANAYRIYFNAYQIHDKQHVPFLMDGQMFGAGNKILAEMTKKLKEKRLGTGAAPEKINVGADESVGVKNKDAFYEGLSDMHPQPLGRRESVKRAAAQRAGFVLASLHAHAAAAALPEQEAAFLRDNLLYPCEVMSQTSAWLEHLLMAHEALDLGDASACKASLEAAQAAFAKMPELAEGYCHGKWKEWYRGCKKLNVAETLKKTSEVAQALRTWQP